MHTRQSLDSNGAILILPSTVKKTFNIMNKKTVHIDIDEAEFQAVADVLASAGYVVKRSEAGMNSTPQNVLNEADTHHSPARTLTQEPALPHQSSNEHFRMAFDKAGIGMALLDLHGRFLEINDAFHGMLGYENGELLGLDMTLFTLREGLDTSYKQYLELVHGKRENCTWEKRFVRKDGSLLWALVSASIVRSTSGEPIFSVGMIQDITERKHAEKEQARTTEALEKAYLREHRIADVLQQSLIPELDVNIDGCQIIARYLPALDEAEVGGDFYDLIHLPDGRLALLVGDISGKGLTAAVHTAMLKYMLRAYIHDNPKPRTVLKRLNRAIYNSTIEDMFVTVLYCVFDPFSGSLTCASAGHDLPLYYNGKTRATTLLNIKGCAIGIKHDSAYTESHIQLNDGDGLIIYTDGVTDARNKGNFLNVEGLAKIVEETADLDSADIIDAIFKAVVSTSGGRLRDDAAVLVVKKTQKG